LGIERISDEAALLVETETPPDISDELPQMRNRNDPGGSQLHVGHDMRTYRCGHCQEEHIVGFGTALWKTLSDAHKSDQ
jgi:hypothetical protein